MALTVGRTAPRQGEAAAGRHNGAVPRRRPPPRDPPPRSAPARAQPDRSRPVASAHFRTDGRPKTQYRSRAEALAAAHDQSNESGFELTAYPCDFCDGWHMGRETPRAHR
jgi:hypothetical protein